MSGGGGHPAAEEQMISATNLSKHYGPTRAVSGISFEISKGEIVGFLGPNGAGKTTTLRMLSGCLAPTTGEVRVAGELVTPDNRELRRRIGYLPENNPLYPDMDTAEYLEWAAETRGFRGEERNRRVRNAAGVCGLGEVLGKPIGLLSKGYRQRVGLAAAIMHDPDVLLLDEPTSGLDPNQSREVRELIRRLKESKTVLLSTHILPEVEASCDRVMIIHKGELAASGTPRELAGRRAGGAALQVSLKSAGLDLKTAQAAYGAVPGVAQAQAVEEDGELRLRLVPGDGAGDLREAAFRLAVERGWTLLRLHKEEASLENIFRELTLS